MRRTLWTASVGLLSLLLAAPPARAVGLGLYGGGGGGSMTWTIDPDDGSDFDEDADTSHGTFGFVLDTAVSTNSVFNYRLNVGADRFVSEFDDFGPDDWELSGIVIDNAFGFAIVRNRAVRLWVGPQLRIAWYEGHPEGREDDEDIQVAAFGLGPVLGLNLNLGPVVTLALDGGFRWVGYGGEWDDDATDWTADLSGTEGMVFLNASVLFRLGERF